MGAKTPDSVEGEKGGIPSSASAGPQRSPNGGRTIKASCAERSCRDVMALANIFHDSITLTIPPWL
jgi:hypothetical protein